MRPWPPQQLEHNRVQFRSYQSPKGAMWGYFCLSLYGEKVRVLSSGEADKDREWEHVSVSLANSKKTPSWKIMQKVKDLFWHEGETVIQFHPPQKEYVNYHPGCLHSGSRLMKRQPHPSAWWVQANFSIPTVTGRGKYSAACPGGRK